MEFVLLPLLLLVGLATALDGGSDGPDDGGNGDGDGGGDENDVLTGVDTDRIFGGAGDDLLTLEDRATGLGGAGADTIYAQDDALGYGLEGDDSLTAEDNATIKGGDGDDTLTASGEAAADGGNGDDWLALSDNSHGYGGDGNDTLTASDAAVIFGGAGDDMLIYQDGGVILSPEDGADIYVLDHASGGASLGFGYESRDPDDRIAIHLGSNDLSNFTFRVTAGSEDGASGPEGEITEIEIIETLPDGTTTSSMLSIRGVYGYNLRNIILYGETIGEEIDWQPYFGENDVMEATGSESIYGGVGNDRLDTEENAVAYGGDGNDRFEALDQSAAYGGAGADTLWGLFREGEDAGDTSVYGGADGDDIIILGGTALGGDGNDELDVLDGATGYGGAGEDTLVAVRGSDVFGDRGADALRMYGGSTGYGGAGDDVITMNALTDQTTEVFGGAGDDLFVSNPTGLADLETIATGGAGADLHAIYVASYEDHIPAHTATITDFDPAEDEIAVYVGPEQIADITVSTSFDAATNTTVVNVMQAFDTAPLSQAIAVFRLEGVQSFTTADLRILPYPDAAA